MRPATSAHHTINRQKFLEYSGNNFWNAHQGATFRIFLPLDDSATPDNESSPEPIRAECGNTILVIDDEVVCRMLAEEVLTHLGYTVHTVENGEDGVAFYRQHWQNIDLVILDMQMPGIGGRDTFFAMKAINPKLRLLLATGYSAEEEAGELLTAGVTDFLQKPFQVAAFSRKVAGALGRDVTRDS